MLTTEATQLLGQAEATQLLEQTLFQAPDIWAPSLPEDRCPPHLGGPCWSTWGSHLGSRILQRLVCTGKSVYYRSYTASGTGRSNTASGTGRSNTASGTGLVSAFIFSQEAGQNTRYLCTLPARGELACREYSDY